MSDGEEGHTTDHSHSGTPDVVSTNTDDRLDDRSDDLLSQGSEIPADNTDPAQASDGLSERDGAPGQSKAQLDTGQNPNEVKETPQRFACVSYCSFRKEKRATRLAKKNKEKNDMLLKLDVRISLAPVTLCYSKKKTTKLYFVLYDRPTKKVTNNLHIKTLKRVNYIYVFFTKYPVQPTRKTKKIADILNPSFLTRYSRFLENISEQTGCGDGFGEA